MKTVNGKLIKRKISDLDEVTQKNKQINQRFESLESQITAIKKQNYTPYLQKVTQEVNTNKSYVQNLSQRISSLEGLTSKQAKQLFTVKISTTIAFLGLCFILFMNNQKQSPEITESMPLIQP